ncbi:MULTISPECIES: hypothetical protein [unclassified Moorena]|uniref:hypothetical protein n=1 Tax=unclassified Moorena TaxID=2683338 RepID=UPI0014007059|nr:MULTISPECIES: hypothetical protein [unclassified Moorena]NEO16678.1 hypothetical protein [Moorena sp. SIO3E8]NEP98641.1 hypothetical protein [Moorena sp. SIO3F7]
MPNNRDAVDTDIQTLSSISKTLEILYKHLKSDSTTLKNNIIKAKTKIDEAVKILNKNYYELANIYQAPPPPDKKDIV